MVLSNSDHVGKGAGLEVRVPRKSWLNRKSWSEKQGAFEVRGCAGVILFEWVYDSWWCTHEYPLRRPYGSPSLPAIAAAATTTTRSLTTRDRWCTLHPARKSVIAIESDHTTRFDSCLGYLRQVCLQSIITKDFHTQSKTDVVWKSNIIKQ